MARMSNREWGELQDALRRNREAAQNDIVAPFTDDEIKEMAYDAVFEATSAWCVAFGVNLRDAIYCEWWETVRTMLVGKRGEAKSRIVSIITLLENMKKEV